MAAYHALGLARVSKAQLNSALNTVLVGFMAEGNTCAMLFNQLPCLHLPTLLDSI